MKLRLPECGTGSSIRIVTKGNIGDFIHVTRDAKNRLCFVNVGGALIFTTKQVGEKVVYAALDWFGDGTMFVPVVGRVVRPETKFRVGEQDLPILKGNDTDTQTARKLAELLRILSY